MTSPLTPAGADLRDFPFMPLDVVRLCDSDLTALATGEEFKAAVLLWCKAWHQVPCASLPDDDRMLAHLAGFGRDVKAWQKVREMALRGFVRCDDGRLYHTVIADKANEALAAKQRQRERTSNATNARRVKPAQRNDDRNDDRDVQRNDDRNEVQGTGTEIGTGIDVGIGSAREPLADLETKLRDAAEWQSEPGPMLAVTGPVQALIEAGADLDADVLPVVRSLAPQCRSRSSWKYFLAAIAQARDDRIAAGKIVSAPSSLQNRVKTNAEKPTIADHFAAFDRRFAAAVARADHSGAERGGETVEEIP